jgi:DNA polymerase elongation subunit (family B)
VHVADFSSMYPSIILSWNMSPETEAGKREAPPLPVYLRHMKQELPQIPPTHCEAPSTHILFDKTRRGLLPLALEKMLALRKEWNEKKAKLPPGTPEWAEADRRSTAYKIAANSFFGVVGASVSRLYVRCVAESITQTGVWLIRKTMEAGEKRNIRSIYGDTDSVFAMGCSADEFRAFVDHCNDVIYPELLKSQGCETNHVKLAYEKQFDRVVFVSAKRYAGRYAHYKGARATEDSRPEVKGLEYKRGDALRLARRLQAECIDALMGGGVEIPPGRGLLGSRSKRREECVETPEHFVSLLESYRRLIFDEILDRDDIVITKKLAKGLGDYAVKIKKDGTEGAAPPHVRIAKMLLERGEDIREGSRISYVVTEDGPIPASDYTGDCDRHSLWNDYVYPPTERLLISAFPSEDWARFYVKRPPKPRAPRVAKKQADPPTVRRRKSKASEENGALFSISASLKGGGK